MKRSTMEDNRWYRSMLVGNDAYSPGSYELIETSFIASNTSTVTFSSIPSTYKHLQLRYAARTNRAASVDRIGLRFNSDSGSNYTSHYLNGTGSVMESYADTGLTNILISAITGASATANIFGVGITDIVDYASASKNTTTKSLRGGDGNDDVSLQSGLWVNTATVTSITLISAYSASFVAGSRFSLYGIKG